MMRIVAYTDLIVLGLKLPLNSRTQTKKQAHCSILIWLVMMTTNELLLHRPLPPPLRLYHSHFPIDRYPLRRDQYATSRAIPSNQSDMEADDVCMDFLAETPH